jgi:hypothetical protein
MSEKGRANGQQEGHAGCEEHLQHQEDGKEQHRRVQGDTIEEQHQRQEHRNRQEVLHQVEEHRGDGEDRSWKCDALHQAPAVDDGASRHRGGV